MTARRTVTADEIESSIAAIQAFYDRGAESLRHSPTYGREEDLREQALRFSIPVSALRKARQFARADTGYRRRDLDALFRRLRRHRPRFGVTAIMLLVTVPSRAERSRIEKACIETGWSARQLEEEIRWRLGPRRYGGRRRRVADDVGGALVQLEEMAAAWSRWCDAAGERAGQKKSLLTQLPEQIRDGVGRVRAAMRRLGADLTDELNRMRARERRRARTTS
jgi:hypothetical protein